MHISFPSHRLDERGDTIVEVLIALAIISSVLSGAFFVTNRSSQNVRDTEEHSQALQLLQSQIEQIRASISDETPDSLFPAYFCYDTAGDIQGASGPADFSQCEDDFGGTSGAKYQFLIAKTLYTPGGTSTFTATVHWEGLHGQTNSEQLLYKIEPVAP